MVRFRFPAVGLATVASAMFLIAPGVSAQDAGDAISGDAASSSATGGADTGDTGSPSSNAAPQTLDELVDFIIRPSETSDANSDDDIWTWNNEPGPSALETPIGPPLAGPTGEEVLGPPLSGPTPEPLVEGRIRPRQPPQSEPFAPVGVNVGSFVIRPAIETGITATDNAAGSPDKVGAVGLIVAPEVTVNSQADRYSFDASARGQIVTYDRKEFNENTADVRAKLRYDLTSTASLNAEAGYSRFLESFNDPNTPAAASNAQASMSSILPLAASSASAN